MTRQQLIKQLKAIIVDLAKPERIWLYGSEASGQATSTSDVDIAFLAAGEYSGEEGDLRAGAGGIEGVWGSV